MSKFESVKMDELNSKWKNAIKRQDKMYAPLYGQVAMRSEFARDYTRIINSDAYKRLKHKTQVFFAPQNDHICTRIEHVNLVESISYTIANYLGLNTELTKAIATAHDIGHSPFGHQGERILSGLSEREFGEKFWHERNGLRFVDKIELLNDYDGRKRNLNLTYAVRDGIISHCGEVDDNGLKPRDEYIDLEKDYLYPNQYSPYTWEGCVVKLADKISYIGRDIEDGKKMKLLSDRDIDKIDKMTQHVKINNTNIINYLVVDVCENSSIENGLCFSTEAFDTMTSIKKFNYEKIYRNEKINPTVRYFNVLMSEIFYTLKKEWNGKSTIFNLKRMKRYYPTLSYEFVNWLSDYIDTDDKDKDKYANKNIYNLENLEDYCRAIIDYMSGMTDNYIVSVYNEIVAF
ncbi:MAG: HD domain-containing protein [Clostridia bacterium]|nr:HD domain-containing protein [Clostridia bacterium]